MHYVLALVLLACQQGGTLLSAVALAKAEVPPTAVATVDGIAIPRKLFEMYVRNGVEELGIDVKGPDAGRHSARVEKAVLDDLIDRALVEGELRRRGIALDPHAIAQAKRAWVARLGGEAAYHAYLAQHDLTEEDFVHVVRQELAGKALRDALTREVRVPSSDIDAFYRRERDNPAFAELFVEPEMASAQHILIAARPTVIERTLHDTPQFADTALADAVKDELSKRRARAEEIRRKAASGEDFGALAREHSDDAATRARGGDLGRFARGAHTSSFDDVVFMMAAGSISDVVQTEYGFHVIKVRDRFPRRTRSLEETRAAIEERLLGVRTVEHLRRWLERRRKEAVVQIDSAFGGRDRAQE